MWFRSQWQYPQHRHMHQLFAQSIVFRTDLRSIELHSPCRSNGMIRIKQMNCAELKMAEIQTQTVQMFSLWFGTWFKRLLLFVSNQITYFSKSLANMNPSSRKLATVIWTFLLVSNCRKWYAAILTAHSAKPPVPTIKIRHSGAGSPSR